MKSKRRQLKEQRSISTKFVISFPFGTIFFFAAAVSFIVPLQKLQTKFFRTSFYNTNAYTHNIIARNERSKEEEEEEGKKLQDFVMKRSIFFVHIYFCDIGR